MMNSHIAGFLMLWLNNTYFIFYRMKPRNNLKSSHSQPATETPFELHFTGGPIVAPDWKDS